MSDCGPYSNCHDWWFWCLTTAHNISRLLKLITKAPHKLNYHNFWLDVWLWPIIYQDAKNWTRKLLENSNYHNFWLEYLIVDHNISRLLKLISKAMSKFKTFITSDSYVWLRTIIYWDPQNWLQKHRSNWNWHNFGLKCLIVDHNKSRR